MAAGYTCGSCLIFWSILVVSFVDVCKSNLTSWDDLETSIRNDKTKYDDAPWMKTGKRLDVELHLRLSSLKSSGLRELHLTFHLSQQWNDPRLTYNSTSIQSKSGYSFLSRYDQQFVWTPDTYPDNAIQSYQHDVTQPNVFIRIYPNGTVYKSNRLSIKSLCKTSIWGFPHGVQICSLYFMSFSFNSDEVRLVWSSTGAQIVDKFTSTNVFIDGLAPISCDEDSDEAHKPCLRLLLKLRRDHEVFVLRVYVPSTVFVLLAYLSLWIDKSQVAARTTLGVICLLSIVTQCLGVMLMSDQADGLIAVDIWMGICLLFTSGAFLVFAVVHNMKRLGDKRDIDSEEKGSSRCYRTQKMQKLIRVIYPIAFIIFNIIYWSAFLTS